MCGIVLYFGPHADSRLSESTHKIKHRGPDDTKFFHQENLAIAFNRLAINDKSTLGSQPYYYKDHIAVVNGEIYNHMSLREEYEIDIKGACDTNVILPLFDKLGVEIISVLDGFYSGLIYNRKDHKLFCIRDYIGKKPLFLGRSGTEIFVTSELKAIPNVDSFEMLPKGVSRIDLSTGAVYQEVNHKTNVLDKATSLKNLVQNAVIKRLPADPFGVFLSGGLDSSIVASIVSKHRKDVIYYALAKENSIDYSYIVELQKYLGIQVKYIDPPHKNTLRELICKVVYTTESYNPSIISNGICTYLLAESAHKDQLKVVLSGEGADELFCGYHMFKKDDDWINIRQQLINDMCFTELRRIDQCCMAHSIENRCPFLDKKIHDFASSLKYDDFFHIENGTMENKFILRQTFESDLPKRITRRKKISFDVGSGIRALTVCHLTKESDTEKQVLKEIWQRFFDIGSDAIYFHSYPVFNNAIASRGRTHK
ncbi:asparagine synthetase B family protein [Candidatus Uabimicrobium amorphum]|uniref:asparagine synthase (glutamine-hydrolyzing) n=1 Tax=Uabimicrobium amorphum TaxID=2596890 RepID=A0A5S9IT77_UABAM|nr:asparagine synthetase B [Candidatus Uabimicrobium amorphum]BBM87111.1 asparagine synthase B [Candidatus Uabimicrobium amorphum]